MRIDVHAHIFSKAYIDGLRRVFGNDNSPTGQDAQRLIKWMSTDPRMTDVEGRLEEMEKWGIGMQVLSVPFHGALVQDRSAAADLTHMAIEMISQPARAYPDRFRVLLALRTTDIEAFTQKGIHPRHRRTRVAAGAADALRSSQYEIRRRRRQVGPKPGRGAAQAIEGVGRVVEHLLIVGLADAIRRLRGDGEREKERNHVRNRCRLRSSSRVLPPARGGTDSRLRRSQTNPPRATSIDWYHRGGR